MTEDYQLNADELTKDVPFALRGIAKSFIKWANNLDANHDGKKDIAQLAPLVIAALPLLQRLTANINWNEVKAWIKASKFSKHEAELEAIFKEIQELSKLI